MFLYLNAWSATSTTIWEKLRGVDLFEGVCH